MIRASLFFVPDTAATGNCNCGAHHLTTAEEVLNFFKMIRGIYCIYKISLNFFFKRRKSITITFVVVCFLIQLQQAIATVLLTLPAAEVLN